VLTEVSYATAGANPNALAYGLGIDFFASIREYLLTKEYSTSAVRICTGATVDACHPLMMPMVMTSADVSPWAP
jgi:hypothetical protein